MAKTYGDIDGKSKAPKGAKLASFDSVGDQFQVSQIFVPEYIEVMEFAVQEGKALRIGLTSDGGALCIALYDDGAVKNNYMRTPEEINTFFRKLYAYCKGNV